MLVRQIEELCLELAKSTRNVLATLVIHPTLLKRIKTVQVEDAEFMKTKDKMMSEEDTTFYLHKDGSLLMRNRLYVPNNAQFKKDIFNEPII